MKVEGLVKYLIDDSLMIVGNKGSIAGEEHIQQYPQRPNIAFVVVVFVDDFGCNVVNLKQL